MSKNSISKAVLACGGWSTRFLPSVKTYAKQLVPIHDRPQIEHIVQELVNNGITDICIVHRPGEESLKKHFTPDTELDKFLKDTGKTKYMENHYRLMSQAKFTFLAQTLDFPYGNGTPILVAKDFIGQDNFIYIFADDLMIEEKPGNFVSQMLSCFDQYHPEVIIGCQKVPHHEVFKYGIVDYLANSSVPHQLKSIVEKPAVDVSPSDFADFGRICLTPKFIEMLKKTAIAKGELWTIDGIKTVMTDGGLVIGLPTTVPDTWITAGDPLNFLKANLALGLKDETMAQDLRDFIKTIL